MNEKISIESVVLTRAEGPRELCRTWHFKSLKEANNQLYANSFTAPQQEGRPFGYDKHDFKVMFKDGVVYTGRYDVQYMKSGFIGLDIKKWAEFILSPAAKKVPFITAESKKYAKALLEKYDLSDCKQPLSKEGGFP